MAEIKCNIFGRVWLLKNFFFSECLYFSEYDIRMLFCYLGEWREMGGGGGGRRSYEMCAGAYRRKLVEKSVIRYARTKWMAPNRWHWFGQVR